MTRDRIIAAIRSTAPSLQAQGVVHLALFGSRARGDETASSDLDVLIDVADNGRFSLLNLSGVALALEDLTGISCQVALTRSLDPAFAARIHEDLVEVF